MVSERCPRAASSNAKLVRVDSPACRVVAHITHGAMNVLRDFRDLKLRLTGVNDGKHRVAPLQKRIIILALMASWFETKTATDHEEHSGSVLFLRLEHPSSVPCRICGRR
jgi:hypothetical protein